MLVGWKLRKEKKMFDRIVITPNPPPKATYANTKVEVTEKRAPTDESVSLLNEMQKEARANIVKTIKINDNFVEGITTVFRGTVRGYVFMVYFKINGEEVIVEEIFDSYKIVQELDLDMFEFFYTQVSKKLTSMFMDNFLENRKNNL
jgi:hypothetical protein